MTRRRADTSLYCYGARYYDPKISVWLSVDPMSSERSWLTPHNFVQNNPINLIDPSGMLDHDYALEQKTGRISLVRETDDDFDVIIAGDGSRKEVDKGVIDKNNLSVPTNFEDGTTADVTTLDVSNIKRKEATDLYEWIANNTEDSYKLTHFSAFGKSDPKYKRFISSSHIPPVNGREQEKPGEAVRKMMDGQGFFQTLDIWSIDNEYQNRGNKRKYAKTIQKWHANQGAPDWKRKPKIKCSYYIRGKKAPVRYN